MHPHSRPASSSRMRAALALAALALVLAALARPLGRGLGNGLLLLMDEVYVIPTESSLFAFEPTVMNAGSGDWWVYGEDARRYYHFTGEAGRPYVAYAKDRAPGCAGFDPHDSETWCD